MTRLNAFYRPEIQRQLEATEPGPVATEPKPNPWHDLRLRPEPRTLPRWARIALKWAIGIILAWWALTWALALIGGVL